MTILRIAARVAAEPVDANGFDGTPESDQVLLDAVLEGSAVVPDKIPDSWNVSGELRLLVGLTGGKAATRAIEENLGKGNQHRSVREALKALADELGVNVDAVKKAAKYLKAGKPGTGMSFFLNKTKEPWFPKLARIWADAALATGKPQECSHALTYITGIVDTGPLRDAVMESDDPWALSDYAHDCSDEDLPEIERKVRKSGNQTAIQRLEWHLQKRAWDKDSIRRTSGPA